VLRVHTLGGLSVRDGARPVAGAAAQPRRMALLALLARAGERGITRETALACLWTDTDEERARRGLTQAVYALRRDLGTDDAITGQRELQLNGELVASDVTEFSARIANGRLEEAVALYMGPFLDGFYVPSAPDFERWTEHERVQLAHQCAGALEQLATAAIERDDPATAARWWRRLAASDPLNARVAMGLMRALAASGDRAGALQHARIYEALVDQELALPPDREVVKLAQELRAAASLAPVSVAPAPLAQAPLRSVASTPPAAPHGASNGAVCIVAIGDMVDARGVTARSERHLVDMLATNLARVPGIAVVSPARIDELRHLGTTAAAAREAGATHLIDGSVYALATGPVRLDLRRVDLATGRIVDVHSTSGPDLFALLEDGAAALAARLG
jgi:DNA-binding SARP family transcriptional activator